MKVYPLFQAGKSLSSKVFYFREESILCSCRQGSLSSVSGREEFILLKFFILEMKVYPLFFQAGKIFGIRAKNELSSVSGREG